MTEFRQPREEVASASEAGVKTGCAPAGTRRTCDIVAEVHANVERLAALRRASTRLIISAIGGLHVTGAQMAWWREECRQLSTRLLVLQDQERRSLARDLHDSTAQHLAALIMNLDLIAATEPDLDAESRRVLAASRSLAEQCAREVRTFAYLLHPPLLDETGLMSALRWFVDGFMKRTGLSVELRAGEVGRLPRPVETALFRVVQESLTNVHRHASKSSVLITLARTSGTVALDVHDDGRGVRDKPRDADDVQRAMKLGVGIEGMRGRVTQLGGTFEITFGDHGTSVCVRVPIDGARP